MPNFFGNGNKFDNSPSSSRVQSSTFTRKEEKPDGSYWDPTKFSKVNADIYEDRSTGKRYRDNGEPID